ncbi:MAG: efflux RND transporter permease subunit [Woeseiaceae bacterium]|nr:efflux RND transporter permease subunit [Woeseiaceae bacterium]
MQIPGITSEKGIIAWFAANHVAANLLMLFIIVAGVISSFSIRKETQPDFELNMIQVQVPYLGAAPQEVEEGVVVKIEEAIQDVEGLKRVRGRANEGMGRVTIEVETGVDVDRVLNDVKIRVDAISTFPVLTEKPVIYKQEVNNPVILIAIHGDLDEYMRKALAQEVRDDLLKMPQVNQVIYFGDRPYEISVEVSEQTLRQYSLTMSEVSQAIKNSSVDLPGGTIKSEGGDILLRTKGQVYTGSEFGQLVLRTFPDGTRLTLNDVATIKDGFAESDSWGRFDGRPTATIQVTAGGQDNELDTARVVKEYIAERRETLPAGVEMDTWIDISHYLEGRLDMMLDNMLAGAILVFLVLSMFLRMKVAFWVMVGLPITFLGCLWLMPWFDVTINMMSVFGFIIVLGIVVDDAIIIGESIYTKIRADGHNLDNVIQGAHRVAMPATFGVLTTIAAFTPMLFVGGPAGAFFKAMGVVVILCLFFSLVESKLILPAHLVHARIPEVDEDDLFHPQRSIPWTERVPRFFLKFQRHIQHGLHSLIYDYYEPFLKRAVRNRGVTLAAFVAVLIVTIGMIGAGIARMNLFPPLPGDFIDVRLQMQSGTAPHVRNEAAARIERAILELNTDWTSENPDSLPMIQHVGVFSDGDIGAQIFVELPRDENRPFNGDEVVARWRDRVGEIPGIKELTFEASGHMGGGPPLSFRLNGKHYPALEAAAEDLGEALAEFEGVFDIRNSAQIGGDEIQLSIKPEAEALGLTMSSLGRQVRQAFYGEEAQRIQRGKDEVKVMVRYPVEERRSVADLQNMRIRTPTGEEVPFESVAEVTFGTAYSTISRLNGERTVTVSADIDPEIVEAQVIIGKVTSEIIPEILRDYPGVSSGLEGSSEEQLQFINDLMIAGVAALFLIYALIAVPLHSYAQPLLIMSVIPFGIIGAVIGHVVMGMTISMFSMFGLIALAGVVVNDSIILVDYINKARLRGVPIEKAVVDAGTQRFRAIMLTSFTTAAGLTPILLEKSLQAQFVIPTAVSLSFGIVFATVITLLLVPALYVLQEDFVASMKNLWNLLLGRPAPTEAADKPAA